jgi:hypothetical protein
MNTLLKCDIIMSNNTKNFLFDGNSYSHFKIRKNNTMYVDLYISTCLKCGDYIESSKSMEEKIYCKCKNIYDIKCKALYRGMYENVLNELIYTKYDESDISDEINNEENFCMLQPSTYGHSGDCLPDSRRCYSCWRYWCPCCGGGVGGMYGKCVYNRCRIGRKNSNLVY